MKAGGAPFDSVPGRGSTGNTMAFSLRKNGNGNVTCREGQVGVIRQKKRMSAFRDGGEFLKG